MKFDLDAEVALVVTSAEALVLFELLQTWESAESTPGDAAEQRALWNLSAALEKVLNEPFAGNYGDVVSAAKAHLAG